MDANFLKNRNALLNYFPNSEFISPNGEEGRLVHNLIGLSLPLGTRPEQKNMLEVYMFGEAGSFICLTVPTQNDKPRIYCTVTDGVVKMGMNGMLELADYTCMYLVDDYMPITDNSHVMLETYDSEWGKNGKGTMQRKVVPFSSLEPHNAEYLKKYRRVYEHTGFKDLFLVGLRKDGHPNVSLDVLRYTLLDTSTKNVMGTLSVTRDDNGVTAIIVAYHPTKVNMTVYGYHPGNDEECMRRAVAHACYNFGIGKRQRTSFVDNLMGSPHCQLETAQISDMALMLANKVSKNWPKSMPAIQLDTFNK